MRGVQYEQYEPSVVRLWCLLCLCESEQFFLVIFIYIPVMASSSYLSSDESNYSDESFSAERRDSVLSVRSRRSVSGSELEVGAYPVVELCMFLATHGIEARPTNVYMYKSRELCIDEVSMFKQLWRSLRYLKYTDNPPFRKFSEFKRLCGIECISRIIFFDGGREIKDLDGRYIDLWREHVARLVADDNDARSCL